MSTVITLEPPYEKSGSVTPTTGRRPVTIPRLKSACQKMRLPTPIARTAPKRSFAVGATRIAPEHEERVEHDEKHAPDEAPVLGEHGEREVAVLIGQEEELVLRPAHEPLARGRPPLPIAMRAWCACQPAPRMFASGFRNAVIALLLVALEAVAPDDRPPRRPAPASDEEELRAADARQRADRDEDRDRG